MYALINHWIPRSTDLSMRVSDAWRGATVAPADVTATGWTRPAHVLVTAAHLTALNALDASDPRREALSGFMQVDLGEPDPITGNYGVGAQEALAGALAPRKARS